MRKRIKILLWLLLVLVLAFVAAMIILKDDDCWPDPEPVPADCKPGKPCPVGPVATAGAPHVAEPLTTTTAAETTSPAAPVSPSGSSGTGG